MKHFLKTNIEKLNTNERTVTLQMDEVYVKPSLSHFSGNVSGLAENCNALATTIQVFMVCSLFSSAEDV